MKIRLSYYHFLFSNKIKQAFLGDSCKKKRILRLLTRKANTMMLLAVLLSLVGFSLAGSPCPPRENIYPCSCLAVPLTKKILFTSVTCHRLSSTDALNSIFPTLRTMTIDHFYLYDSFWEANTLESDGEDKRVLPADWLTMLKIKEIEIVDTTLSECFACNSKITCRNDVTTRFTAVNSSSHEKICTLCDIKSGGTPRKFSWTGCMNKLRQFHFRHGKLTVVKADLFPLRMRQLTEVDLSYNSITKVESNALSNLIKLKLLRLSHNALESIATIAMTKLEELEELDVSWNQISTLSKDFIASFPVLKTLVMNNNYIVNLKLEDWKNFPVKYLRTIDLRENPIECDCNIRWINGTFPVHTAIQGHCAGPEDLENSLIRTASRMLIQRCTEDGKIGTRKKTTKAAVTRAMNES